MEVIVPGCLGKGQDQALVKYVQHLQEDGFPPTSKSTTQSAFSLTEKTCIPHRCNRLKSGWSCSWNSIQTLIVRKAQGLSTARGLGMCRQEAHNYFAKLVDLPAKRLPSNTKKYTRRGSMRSANERGTGKVDGTRGSRDIHRKTSVQKPCNGRSHYLL
jgi:hypothetical protein